MTRVLVFGTFDGLHKGHKDLFRQARQYGDYLVVVIGRDSTVGRVKKRLPQFTELDRQKAVQECGLVDQVILGNEGSDPYKIIEQIQPDVICLGYDQTHFTDKLAAALKEIGLGHIEIKRLEAFEPEKYKSSILNRK